MEDSPVDSEKSKANDEVLAKEFERVSAKLTSEEIIILAKQMFFTYDDVDH